MGGLLRCVGPLTDVAADVAGRYHRAAGELRHAVPEPALPLPAPPDWPTDLGQDLYVIADLRAWLEGLREDVDRI
jgi:hypothetical protein